MGVRIAGLRDVVVGAGVASAVAFATADVQEFRVRPYLDSNLYLPSGKFIEEGSLGYRELAADMVWFQAIQYYGGYAKSQHDLAYFDGLIGIVNQLDPYFVFPYLFGAVVLAQDMGDLERGVGVLRRGMHNNPTVWELPFEIGFLHYTIAHDAEQAARYFELAARMPGGRDQARRFAAFVHSRAGHKETSIRMWEQLARDTTEPYMRSLAERYIAKMRAELRAQDEEARDGS